MPRTNATLSARDLASIVSPLRKTNGAVLQAYPGEPESRQPVHTVYGGAHLFRADSAQKLGAVALSALEEYAPDAKALHAALHFGGADDDVQSFAATIRSRV